MSDERWTSPLGSRYASPAIQRLWGEPHRIGLAALCVVGAFFTLTFYDFFALRTIGKNHVPYRIAALSSFTSYTIGHNIGATVFTGGAIRYQGVDLAGMEGLDSQGNAGLRHKVDRHYKRLFGFAALTSLFTAAFEVSQRRNQSVLTYPNPSDTAAAAVGREMSQTGAMITRRNLNVQPTIRVPVGYKFTVRVNRDILFDAPYEALTPDPQVLPPGRGLLRRSGM